MLVKKFEARTMKEALDMVKREFGPEAIILNAKDNSQRFGLLGQGSVEVTAAVYEGALQKKKFVESKLPENLKSKYANQPAKLQKHWVNQVIESYERNRQDEQPNKKSVNKDQVIKAIRERRYVDIPDDIDWEDPDIKNELEKNQKVAPAPQQMLPINNQHEIHQKEPSTVELLKNEIADLKKYIQSIKEVSQPKSHHDLPASLETILSKLRAGGIRYEYALSLVNLAQKNLPPEKINQSVFVEGWLIDYILKHSPVVFPEEKVQFFWGPAGSGKTSFMLKWAVYLKMRLKRKVAIVNFDNRHLGKVQTLRIFCQILNVPFINVIDRINWQNLITQLSDCDHFLCDFAVRPKELITDGGYSQHTAVPHGYSVHRHIVLNLNWDRNELSQLLGQYVKLGGSSVSFSHVDASSQRGFIFELQQIHKIPLFAISTGGKLTEDFEVMGGERLADFVLQISQPNNTDLLVK